MTGLSAVERVQRCRHSLIRWPASRPVWVGDDGWLRVGHSGDMIEMLERLGVKTSAQ